MRLIHGIKCGTDNCQTLQLSLDGIKESKSSTATIDVFSITFEGCQKVYPVRLIKPSNKYRYDEQEQIKKVVDDINDNSCTISEAIFDQPKRSRVRCALQFNSTYPCEYCEARAVLIQDLYVVQEIESVKKKQNLDGKAY